MQNAATEDLDRASDLPLFLQIRQRLLREILDWPVDDRRFPPEAQLAERFGVSKMTVRQALHGLVEQGLLARRRGAGTVVTDEAVSVERLTPALDIDQQHRAAGRTVETEVLAVRERPAEAAEAGSLDLPPQTPLVEIRRLRRIGGAPAALDHRLLAAELSRRAGFDETTAAGSIIDRLRAVAPVARGEWRLSAHHPDGQTAALLMIGRDVPVLTRALVYRDGQGRALMIGRTVHRSDLLACEVAIDLHAPDAAGR
ncbi:MAG: GntR family transcriptional regulator [Marivibrio sp.]|uniref:GntR family transcriptional regulator n=1 Tax=Marivibrio sp. TaxID=2039719 RepID=UPI0032EF7F38